MGLRSVSNVRLVRNAIAPTPATVESLPVSIDAFTPRKLIDFQNIKTTKSVLGKYFSNAEIAKAMEKNNSAAVGIPRSYWAVFEKFFDANNLARFDFQEPHQFDRDNGMTFTAETVLSLGGGKSLFFAVRSLRRDTEERGPGWPDAERTIEAFIRIIDSRSGKAWADFYLSDARGYPGADAEHFHLSTDPDLSREDNPALIEDIKKNEIALAKFVNLIMNGTPIDLSKLKRREDTEFFLKRF
jgi:hypothetical protein